MIKKLILLLLFLSLFFNLCAQETVVPGGNYHQNISESISWSLGQTAIHTLNEGNNIITQGFQQSLLIITSIEELHDLNFSISIYPNPTQSYINLKVNRNNLEQFEYTIANLDGKIIKQGKFDNNPLQISFTEFNPAVYILSVNVREKQLKTFKVIKQ